MPIQTKSSLIVYSVLVALALSAFIFAPIVSDRLHQNMYVFAHTGDISAAPFSDFRNYIIILLAAIICNCLFSREQIKSNVYKASLFLTMCIVGLAVLSMNPELMTRIAKKVHIGLHFWFTWRFGMYLCFMTSVIAMYALSGVANNLLRLFNRTSKKLLR